MKSPVELLRAVLTDVRRLSRHTQGLDRDILTINKRVENEGDSFLSVTLPVLGAAILSGLETGRFTCPRNFSKVRGGSIPKLFSGMIREIFDINTGILLEEPCIECIQNMHQITRLFKKLSTSDSDQPKLFRAAQAEYVQNEEHIRNVRENVPKRCLFILGMLSRISLSSLNKFRPEDLQGKHGPGAVYEGMSPNDKWRYLPSAIFSDSRFGDTIYPEFLSSLGPIEETFVEARSVVSNVLAVPKTRTSLRLITVEPHLNQFIQGGLNSVLRRHLSSGPLSGCIALDRQDVNQKLALDGSHTRHYSTIDLKSASDLIDNELVHRVFAPYPEFFKLMMWARTPHVVFGGIRICHEKYAGMGNATTFPVQSTIFALICIGAILDHMGKIPTYRNVKRIASNSIQVYGDDIIVETRYYDVVCEWLTSFGLKVNASKSFSKGYFRESCGVDAYKGVDITPVYVKHWPSRRSAKSHDAICNLVAVSNLLWERGYCSGATFVQEMVEELIGKLPLVSRRSSALGWTTRQDAVTISRWNKALHRFEFRGVVPKPKRVKDRLTGIPALLKFFHKDTKKYLDPFSVENGADDHLEYSDKRYNKRLSKQWCAVA